MQLKLSTLTECVISFKVSLTKGAGAIEGFMTEITLLIFSGRLERILLDQTFIVRCYTHNFYEG